MRAWLAAFVFTQLVEVPIYSVGLRCRPWVAFGASAITHPIVWLGLPPLVPRTGYVAAVVMAELFAWLMETAYFALLLRRRRAWFWALVANGASLGAGLLSRSLFGVP
jgi:hypothetical protein